ncbi:MAG TPA: DUF2181 domain-containing protein [Candidatus Rifleibacterium sp.]|nr:DUF2181 domain-containing protein [Candidatus Rifleibacterium sp.]HPT46239.1 DUF2181 domain-containing protein [Candidatus Rifleibacterium sp.]
MKYLLSIILLIGCLLVPVVTIAGETAAVSSANPLAAANDPIIIKSGNNTETSGEKPGRGPFGFLKSIKNTVVDGYKKFTGDASDLLSDVKSKFTGMRDKFSIGFKKFKEFFPKISRLPALFVQETMSAKKRQQLEKIAAENADHAWPLDGDIANVVNAHYTNTFDELKKALESDCNWFECDVRPEGPLRRYAPFLDGKPRPVTAHDSYQTNGMLFDDWVRIVAASGRGIKVDLKDNSALDGVLATLKKYQVDERRIILNINVSQPGNGPKAGEDARLKKIRKEFPGCRIKLSPGGGSSKDGKYTDAAVARLIEYAKAAGKPVMYALRAEWVTPEIVKKLEPYGNVSIWNSPSTFDPTDVKKEVDRFRSWGATGMIDLMTSHH